MNVLKPEKLSEQEKTSLLHRLQIGAGGVLGVLLVLMLADIVLFDTAEDAQSESDIAAQDSENPALADVEVNEKEDPLTSLGVVPTIEEGKGAKAEQEKQKNKELVPDLEQEKIDLEETKKAVAK